jgi:excisionase family DNA binding protein
MTDELLVTVREAGRRLGVGRSTTYQLLWQGAFPSVRIGSSRRIAVKDLEAFIERLKERTTRGGNL